jgi:hypothetical protein
MTIAKRYPLYSKSDKVLWMLGDIYEKSEHKEIASLYYGDIVKNYPLSGLAPTAKNKLVAFKVPVPQPDPKAVAWMTAEQNTPRPHESLVRKPLALVRTGPHGEMVASAKSGTPTLEPEADNTSATDILSGGNRSQLGGGAGGARNTAVVETVTPGGAAPTATESTTPAEGAPTTAPEAVTPDAAAPAAAQPPAAGNATGANGTATSLASDSTASAAASGTGSEQPAKADSAATADAQSADANKTDSSQSTDDQKDSKKESSSKKKKGLRKVVPW